MTRKQAAEKIFKFIESIGFKVRDIKYGDGYFIFDKGEDSVVHFRIKGLRGWLFGMWIDTNPDKLKKDFGEYPAVQLFCQHKDNIDKFKPSRSYFLIKLSLSDIADEDYIYGEYEIKQMLGMIKRHPVMSYVMDRIFYEKYFGHHYIPTYIKGKFQTKKYAIRQWCEDWVPYCWTKTKMLIIKKNRIVEKVSLFDHNCEGWICSPRFKLRIFFKENSTDEDEVKFLDRWFKKDDYWNLRVEYGRVGVKGCYVYERAKR